MMNFDEELLQDSDEVSSEKPNLHSRATDPFANGLGDISCAVLANPAKIKEEIRELSNHEQNPQLFTNMGDDGNDITDEEKMHVEDMHKSAEELLMEKMETAGFTNPKTNSVPVVNFQAPSVAPVNDRVASSQSKRFFNIPQPAPAMYDNAIDDPMDHDTMLGFDNGIPAQQPTDSYHARFTAPQSEMLAEGMSPKNNFDVARTQAVQINTDKNVVNTFDNSIYATQMNPSMQKSTVEQQQQQQKPMKNDRSESSTSKSKTATSASKTATESDATAYAAMMKEKRRQQKKEEKRRRERLPHERTVGDMEKERYIDWERKVQQDVKEEENNEKREFLLLFAEKEQEGYKMLRQFNMNSNINEMRFWYYKILRDARTDDEVAHLRSHLVEGTRILLYLNENIFQNPLGLSNMQDFPDALSSMLIGSWDRHIRDYVKNKNGLQGPPPQPLRNLGLNFLHLFISHHRKKAAEEQKEKAQRESAQKEAMMAAAAVNRGSNVALNPFEAIFGGATSHMRGREGINPMELPPYANVSSVPVGHDKDYEEFLQLKRSREQEEFRAFLDQKYGRTSVAPQNNFSSASQNLAKHSSLPAQQPLPRGVPPPPSPMREQREQAASMSHSAKLRKSVQPLPPSFLNERASPLPNDLGPPEVASIDLSTDFPRPASQDAREQLTQSNNNVSNSRLVGKKNATQPSLDDESTTILLSTSRSGPSSDSSMSAKREFPEKKSPTPPAPATTLQKRIDLPRAYQVEDAGSKLLKNIGRKGGISDERLVPLPPVPDISRENVQKLQQKLASQTKTVTFQQNSQQQQQQQPVTSALKTLRPLDREKVEKLLSLTPPKKTTVKKEEQVVKQVVKPVKPKANDYESLLAEMEAECDALDEDEETVLQYNDVKTIPKNASHMDSHNNDNRILDMLTMFQNFMNGPPKGTRPTAQTSMFSNIDSLMVTGDDTSTEIKKSSSSSSSKNESSGASSSKSKSKKRRAKVTPDDTDSATIEDKSSSASFHVSDGNESLAAQFIDSTGHFGM